LFAEHTSGYIGADVACAAGVSLDVELFPGAPAPLADASVDTILSTQVLEHVYDFHSYLKDCHRLLMVQGRLILTVPMQWRHHEIPYDYWRFTRFGVEQMLYEAGFRIVELTPCGGVYSLLGQVFLDHLAERRKLRPWLTRFINHLSLFVDKRVSDCEDTLGWMCLAEKN
jgi:SAM-dependent methyltransferase